MNTDLLETKFARIGARLKLADQPSRRFRGSTDLVTLDVQTDRKGEFFAIIQPGDGEADVEVLDVQPSDRHLLLLVRENGEKHKFLCGHDERHWFVAGIPEKAPVGTVRQAKEALKPAPVRAVQAQKHLKRKARERRKNAAYVRQGEWFFIPVPDLVVDKALVLRNEPLLRGNGSKPHWAQFCYRSGGETVYVSRHHPDGISQAKYREIITRSPDAKRWGWQVLTRNPEVHARGRISHADHKTIVLNGWHQVVMNTEGQSKAMRNVAFLD